MLKIITLNVNGIRAAERKGLFEWLANENADVICMQEVRASQEILDHQKFKLTGYEHYYLSAMRPGYSGVGILAKKKPDKVVTNLGFELSDQEARYVHIEYGDLVIASVYLPSGSSKDERQLLKYEYMDKYFDIMQNQLKQKKSLIICGDWNIVHTKDDIKNFSANQKNSGCLPEERAWLDKLFTSGFTDAFRLIEKRSDQYTWWSNRGRAWDNNVGWRIDYQVISDDLKNKVKSTCIYKDQRFSDHSPVIMEYDLSL